MQRDDDGRVQLKIERHRHESLLRLELQIDVLKGELGRWPGDGVALENENAIRGWYEKNCWLQGVGKLEVVVPEKIVSSKAELAILIEVLTDSANKWRSRVKRLEEDR